MRPRRGWTGRSPVAIHTHTNMYLSISVSMSIYIYICMHGAHVVGRIYVGDERDGSLSLYICAMYIFTHIPTHIHIYKYSYISIYIWHAHRRMRPRLGRTGRSPVAPAAAASRSRSRRRRGARRGFRCSQRQACIGRYRFAYIRWINQ